MNDEKEKSDNIVFIGSKPFMNYVTSLIVQFTNKKRSEVIVKARGKWTSRAIDVVERVRKRFLREENIQIKHIRIDSEEVESREGKKVNISLIEITLGK